MVLISPVVAFSNLQQYKYTNNHQVQLLLQISLVLQGCELLASGVWPSPQRCLRGTEHDTSYMFVIIHFPSTDDWFMYYLTYNIFTLVMPISDYYSSCSWSVTKREIWWSVSSSSIRYVGVGCDSFEFVILSSIIFLSPSLPPITNHNHHHNHALTTHAVHQQEDQPQFPRVPCDIPQHGPLTDERGGERNSGRCSLQASRRPQGRTAVIDW